MSKLNKKEIERLVELLEGLYPNAECALDHQGIFQLLIAVVLSAQTTDKSVNLVTPALFERAPNAAAIAAMEQEELEQILKRIGMYRTKAKNIKALCVMLSEKYNGQVPEDYDKLTELPGVGRKTANRCIISRVRAAADRCRHTCVSSGKPYRADCGKGCSENRTGPDESASRGALDKHASCADLSRTADMRRQKAPVR